MSSFLSLNSGRRRQTPLMRKYNSLRNLPDSIPFSKFGEVEVMRRARLRLFPSISPSGRNESNIFWLSRSNSSMPSRKSVRSPSAEFSMGSLRCDFSALKSHLREPIENSADGLRTLFLDGIDELDLESQKILLSFLPDGDMEGNNLNRARLITSTSPNLEKGIESGRFRSELYFRINGVCLRLPLLRDRKEDIRLFVGYFLAKHAAELGHEAPALSDKEMEFLVRLEPAHREEDRSFSLKVAARTASRRAERDLIGKALEQTHWNRKRAAQQLQISYKSLLYKIKQTGLEGKQGGTDVKEQK